MNVTFYGVRGSTPCACSSLQRYGGNTSCVVVDIDDGHPIILDLGTGLRFFGDAVGDGPFRATALVTHLHWDHIQGLPFFTPIHRPDTRLDVFGPSDNGLTIAEAFTQFMNPPLFPIHYSELIGEVEFHDTSPGKFSVGAFDVTCLPVPHVGLTYGYRIEHEGVSVVYISDHQMPTDDRTRVAPEVLELCEGADLVIHDAQFTPEEFEPRAHWGHCTIGYAVEVAKQAGARSLALFHHDPSHHDELLDQLTLEAKEMAADSVLDVFAAQESQRLSLHR